MELWNFDLLWKNFGNITKTIQLLFTLIKSIYTIPKIIELWFTMDKANGTMYSENIGTF